MKKKYLPCWCGVLLLLGSFPITSWCIEASLDTSATSAAVTSLAAKLSHADSATLSSSGTPANSSTSKSTKLPEASASVTLQQEQSSLPSSPPQAEPTEPAIKQGPKGGLSETAESADVEELHSSFDEAAVGLPEPVPEVDSISSDSSNQQEAAPANPQNPVDSPSTTAEFVSSEASLSDPLHSVTVSPLPLTPVPSDNQNDSLLGDLDPNNTTTEDTAAPPRAAAGSKHGVSDATLPPDLVPQDFQLPTSTPNTEHKTDKNTPSPDVPNPISSTPDGTQKPAVEGVQKPPTAVTEPIKVPIETVPGSVTNVSEETDTGEEIPSFNEWAQKKLADAEKVKVQNASDPPKAPPKVSSSLKVRSKNYASPDCGAKILAANPEAQSVSSVLSPSRDEYALNPCTSSKIWFVVELCEAIQAKQVELANFELFSSSPKDFSVWVSDRFPTREWHQVGQFTAQDERDIQTFPVQSNIFAKYVKVEQHSHWGSEHFCPVSLLHVYGTSEFEVLDDEGHLARAHDDDDDGDDDITTAAGKDAPNNLFGSARDAVINIVKKAAQVLGKSGHPKNTTEAEVSAESNVSCGITPSPVQKCSDCSPTVQNLLMCQPDTLKTLLASRFVLNSLHQNQLCYTPGAHKESYLAAMLPVEYISALCHLLLVFHGPRESSTTAPSYDNLTLGGNQARDPFLLLQPSETTTCSGPQVSSSTEAKPVDNNPPAQASVPPSSSQVSKSDVASQIRPTGTLKDHEMSQVLSVPAPVVATTIPDVPAPQAPAAGSVVPAENSTVMASTETPALAEEEIADADQRLTTEEWTNGGEPLDTLLAELKEESTELDQNTPSTPTPSHMTDADMEAVVPSPPPATLPTLAPSTSLQQGGQQKESVFVRLANRIKVLERNMSLSAQYLEELSRRYKKQVEEMQRAFEKTLAAVGEAARHASQREQGHAEQLSSLEQRFTALAATTAALLAERESWQNRLAVLSQPLILLAVLVSCLVYLVRQCSSSSSYRELTPEPLLIPPRRRSLETIGVTRHRKRRPSEEAAVCEQRLLARNDARSDCGIGDLSRKKRRKVRQVLRGVSVEELCSGLSPATLATVRQPIVRPKHRLPTSPKSRRFSTESAPFLKCSWVAPVISSEVEPEEVPVNGDVAEVQVIQPSVEVITSVTPPSPSLQQKKESGLRKMVRKLF